MNYQKQEIKPGITLHQIYTENYKTNLNAIFLATPLKKKRKCNFRCSAYSSIKKRH